MSYDLSGSIVSETYQRLLQVSPGDNQTVLNGSGSQPNILYFNTASAELFSGSFYGDGNQLTNITTTSINDFDLEVSRSAVESGFGNFTLDGTGVYSSSNQIFPTTTQSITDFNLEVSRSAASYGFGDFSIDDLNGNGIVSNSQQISDYDVFLEKIGDNVVTSSDQIIIGSGLVSQSEQIGLSSTDNVIFNDITASNISADSITVTTLTYTTISLDFSTGSNAFGDSHDDIHIFTGSIYFSDGLYGSGSFLTNLTSSQIDNFTLDVSKSAADSGFGNFTLEGTGVYSSSNQIFPTTTQSITDFNLEVSRSAAEYGFGNFSIDDLNGNGIISTSQQIDDLGYYKSGSRLHIYDITASDLPTKASEFTPLVIDSNGNIGIGSDYTADTGEGTVNMNESTAPNKILVTAGTGTKNIKEADSTIIFNGQSISGSGAILNSNIVSASEQISNYDVFLEKIGDNVVTSSNQILIGSGIVSESEQLGLSSTDNVQFNDITASDITASNIIANSITVTTLTYTTISLDFSTGSNAFGDSHDDIHIFSGSIYFSDGLYGSGSFLTNLTSSQIDNFSLDVSKSAVDYGFGNFNTDGTNIVSSSEQISNYSFYSSSYTFINAESETIPSYSLCIISDSKALYSTAHSESKAVGVLAIAKEDILTGESGEFHLHGFISIPTITNKSSYYISTNSGEYSELPPVYTDEYVRIIGYSPDDGILDFRPDNSYILLGTGSNVEIDAVSLQDVLSTNTFSFSGSFSGSMHTSSIDDFNLEVSRSAAEYGFGTGGSFSLQGTGVYSSSEQIFPITTQSITDFNLEVSRSAAEYGFGSGGSFSLVGTGVVSQSEQIGLSSTDDVVFNSLNVGTIIASEYIVSSSVSYITTSFSSGSTIFGDTLDDTHQFTGSVYITNSLNVDGIIYGSGSGLTNIPTTSISNFDFHVSNSIVSSGFATYDVISGGGLKLENNNFGFDFTTLQPVDSELDLDDKFAFLNVSDELHKTVSLRDMGKILEPYFKDNLFVSYSMAYTGSFSGSFIGDGSGLYNIGTESINNFYSHVSGVFSEIFDCDECLEGTGIISTSQQLADLGFISDFTGTGILSSSTQLQNYFNNNSFNISGSFTGSFSGSFTGSVGTESIDDFFTHVSGVFSEIFDCSECLSGSGIISQSEQVDFEFITNKPTIFSSSNQFTQSLFDAGFNTLSCEDCLSGSGIISHSDQLTDIIKISTAPEYFSTTPHNYTGSFTGSIHTTSIDDFPIEVSRSAAQYGFGSGGTTYNVGANGGLLLDGTEFSLEFDNLASSAIMGYTDKIAYKNIGEAGHRTITLHEFAKVIEPIISESILYSGSTVTSSGQIDYTQIPNAPQNVVVDGDTTWLSGSFTGSFDGDADLDYLKVVGDAVITGSLTVSGSNTFRNYGPAIFEGNTTITGSTLIKGNISLDGYIEGSSIYSSSNQIFPITTQSITDFNLEVSRSAAQYGFGEGGGEFSLDGTGVYSSSEQIFPVTTQSITDFNLEVSRSAAQYGFASNTGVAWDGQWLVMSVSQISNQSEDISEHFKFYVYGDGNFNFNSISTASIQDDRLYYYEIKPTGSETLTVTNDIVNAMDNFGGSIPVSGSETLVGNMYKNPDGLVRIIVSPLE